MPQAAPATSTPNGQTPPVNPTPTGATGEPTAPKKWVGGKYASPEEMEVAIQTKDQEYVKLNEQHSQIKEKYDSLTRVLDSYQIPENFQLSASERAILDRAAKKAGLTQDHYSKVVEEFHAEEVTRQQAYEDRRKQLGEEKLNVVSDYVKKFYPEKVQNVVFNEIIKDDEAMTQAMNDRDKRLNSSAPGMDAGSTNVPPPKYDGQGELLKARDEWYKNPTQANKDKYIEMARQVGETRYKK